MHIIDCRYNILDRLVGRTNKNGHATFRYEKRGNWDRLEKLG